MILNLYTYILRMTRTVTLYFVRHGHADHNAGADKYGDYAYWDPVYTNARLTEKGIMQSKKLSTFFKNNKPDLVFSSSLRRCLETLDYALIDYNNDIHVDDRIIEKVGEHPCNKRGPKNEIHTYLNRPLNLTFVNDEIYWTNKRESSDEMINRAKEWYSHMLDMLKENENICKVAIFSHYDFLTTVLTKGLHISSTNNGRPFNNCEVREIEICF